MPKLQPGSLRPEVLTSGIVPKRETEASGRPTLQSVEGVIRGFLADAVISGVTVRLTLRGDPERGIPIRIVDGQVRELRISADGRERAVIAVSSDAEQVVLLERIARVMAVSCT